MIALQGAFFKSKEHKLEYILSLLYDSTTEELFYILTGALQPVRAPL